MDRFAKLHAARAAKALQPAPQAAEIQALLGTESLPELTQALRDCDARQRIVLKALAEGDFVVKRAVETLGLLYDWAKPAYVRSVLRRETTQRVRSLLETAVAESVGITAASTLARINAVVESAIGTNDHQNALRGLGLLAEATQAIKRGNQSNVNVGVQVMVPVEQRYDTVPANIRVIDA
jgi:hypothetical protein